MPLTTSPCENVSDPLFRLTHNVVPIRYQLEFLPRPDHGVFHAKAALLFEVKQPYATPATALVLHARRLEIAKESVSFTRVDSADASLAFEPAGTSPAVKCVDLALHPDTSETCVLTFATPLPNEKGALFAVSIGAFTGHIYRGRESSGLFQSTDRDPYTLATHLEPTSARLLYPCYDEPCFQSVFQIAVVADSAYTVVSNTLPEREEPYTCVDYIDAEGRSGGAGLRRTTFQPTPPLHACITGFVIGKFLMVEQQSRERGVLCRVIFPNNQPQHAGWFALDLLTKAVDFFDDFFDYTLPLQKLDLVAVEEFCSLGMENWGMIVILMEFLLVTETTTLERRQRITRLVGHEVCHHWFGNWASVAWWEYLWLKEGLCRFTEYYFTDAVNPNWCMWNDFVGNIVDPVLVQDANPALTHPVQHCDSHPRMILKSFTSLSYAKGAALLRMLFTVIGTRTLRKAAHLLMTRHANDSMNVEQFAAAIHDAHDMLTAANTDTLPNQQMNAIDNNHTSSDNSVSGVPAVVEAADGPSMHATIDSVLALAKTPGHPYVLVQRVNSSNHGEDGGAYRISQFHMPLLHRGVLPFFVRQQRQKHGAMAIDLLTPAVATSFEWDPAKVLRATDAFTFPIRVLALASLFSSSTTNVANNINNSNTTDNGNSDNNAENSSDRGDGVTGTPGSAAPPYVSTVHTILMDGHTCLFNNPTGPTRSLVAAATALAASSSSVMDGATGSLEPTPSTLHSPSFSHPTQINSFVTSPAAVSTSSASPGNAASVHYYFNYEGSGAFRCDYDIATWQRVFELAPLLKDEDRMSITCTLARLRHVNIGHFPYEPDTSDRCTLFLEWLTVVTQSTTMMNSFLWSFITSRLEELVYMTQNAFCGRIFCDFVSSLYLPLHQRCLLSFFPQERTVHFLSHLHLSRSTVADIMHLLALCGSPLIAQDCREVATWALASLFPHSPLTTSCINSLGAGGGTTTTNITGGVGGGGAANNSNDGAGLGVTGNGTSSSNVNSINNATVTNGSGFGSPSFPISSSSLPVQMGASHDGAAWAGSVGGTSASLASSRQQQHHQFLLSSSPTTTAPAPPALPSGATHMDFTSEAHRAAVTVALQYLVQKGDVEVWAHTASVAAAATRMDVEQVERDVGVSLPFFPTGGGGAGTGAPGFDSSGVDVYELTTILPAFFSLDDDKAFEFMADALDHFSRLALDCIKALIRNTRFLCYLLESRRSQLSPRMLSDLITNGAELCSNGHAITLLKASVLFQANTHQGMRSRSSSGDSDTSSVISEYRAFDFMGDLGPSRAQPTGLPTTNGRHTSPADEAITATSQTPSRDTSSATDRPAKRKLLSPGMVFAFDLMESNCVWMDYCGDHFDRFLRKQCTRRMWMPCEPQLDSRSTPMGVNLVCSVGSPLSAEPGASGALQEPVGGISI